MHGIPALVKAHSKRSKVFWACVCVIGMGMFLITLILNVKRYFEYPTVINVEQVRGRKQSKQSRIFCMQSS